MNIVTKKFQLPDGREITLETGKLAKQADGAVMLTCGKTMLLATVCAAKDAVPGTDFMPLQVEYREKYASIGPFKLNTKRNSLLLAVSPAVSPSVKAVLRTMRF